MTTTQTRASFAQENAYSPDNLLAGDAIIRTQKLTLLSGQNLSRGALLGIIALGAASSAAKTGGNTGNGTLTMDATTPVKAGAKAGIYQVRFTAAAANNGTFRVTDPDGFVIGEVVMAGGAGAFDNDIKFAIADGSTDFAVGDGFDVTVAAGSGKAVLSLAAANDGSQVPSCILAESVDASAADKECIAYISGDFNSNAITFGTGHTAASTRDALRNLNIYLHTSVSA